MRERLEAVLGDHTIYQARRAEFATGQKIPFRVSPKPLELTDKQKREIQTIGADITSFFLAADQLYKTDERVRALLNTGKPEIFLTDRPTDYLFVRPDLIITPHGFTLCEIETSPFGLALAEIVNRGYTQEGFETLVPAQTLPEYIKTHTPAEGTIIYSEKTKSYTGQLTFLADQVFSGENRSWNAQKADNNNAKQQTIYRGFYLSEYLTDPSINLLVNTSAVDTQTLPSLTPRMEEKAILALFWDRRFEQYFIEALGKAAFNHLRQIIPPAWIVGQEEYFAPGLPYGIQSSIDLATLSRSKRAFVIKSSGFGNQSSWAEGVTFLHEQSADNAKKALHAAVTDTSGLHIVQTFHRGEKIPMEYETDHANSTPMLARIRLTPYFSVIPGEEGKLLAIKATGCENTDYIHATSTSINTAVS